MLRPKKLFLAANLPVKINAATKLPQSSWKRLKSRNECIPWQENPRFWRPSRACYGHTAQCLGGDLSGVACEQHEVIERLRATAVEQVQCWKFQSYFHMMSQHSAVTSCHFGRSVSDLEPTPTHAPELKNWLCAGIVRGCSWLKMHCWFGVKYNAVRG